MKKPKIRLRRLKKVEKAPSRITNETVAEHRERILAGGRKFKYPMQYARHRLVITTILVTIAALVLMVLFSWWQLYSVQTTNAFYYRVTRVLPLPVASIDGENVRYGDYLMYYNSSAHYLEQSEQVDLNSDDGKRQVDYIKRKSMDNVVADTYANKLAREMNIRITDDQVNQVIDEDRNTANGRISQETYDASALSVLGWSPAEYRQDIRSKLIRRDVSYAIDERAKSLQEQAAQLLSKPGADLDKVAVKLGGAGDQKVTAGVSGLVPKSNRDGGLSAQAALLKVGKLSGVVQTTTGDGYYFIRLLESTDTQVNYAYLKIPLTAFIDKLVELKSQNKIKEYISIPGIENQYRN